MLAAEHGGLPGGKVGGIGDVIAQLPQTLLPAFQVDVVVPSYGVYQLDSPEWGRSERIADAIVSFAGSKQTVTLYRLPSKAGAGCWVIDHPLFGAPPGQIYHDDPDNQPFATDANIYALFCAAAVALLKEGALALPDVVHLHDWHAATFALLARNCSELSSLKLVYTIHNLALQGIRPLEGHPSSLASWFPALDLTQEQLRDPRYPDCYNPARAAILLADKVHVVSPSYASEVLESNQPDLGFHGGEGLEADLRARSQTGDLIGILNGCDYPEAQEDFTEAFDRAAPDRAALQRLLIGTLIGWIGENDSLRASDFLARETIADLGNDLANRFLLTSVGRVTQQKVGLLLHSDAAGKDTLLDRLLIELGDAGACIMLGSGDVRLEKQLVAHAARHRNFVFMRGYSDSLAQKLYENGDLFLMPSLFEPCGISQLLAMRSGQPCLVHATGGLKDTVEDGVDGFAFEGGDLLEKAMNCELAFKRALRVKAEGESYERMRRAAGAKRITWPMAARRYADELYI